MSMNSLHSDTNVTTAQDSQATDRRSSQLSGPSVDNLPVSHSPFEFDMNEPSTAAPRPHVRKISESGSISSMTAQLENTKLGSNQNLTMTSSHASLPPDTTAKYNREKESRFLQQQQNACNDAGVTAPVRSFRSTTSSPVGTPHIGDKRKLLTRRASDPVMCEQPPQFSKSKSVQRLHSLNSMKNLRLPSSLSGGAQHSGSRGELQAAGGSARRHTGMSPANGSFVTDTSLARETDLDSNLMTGSVADGILDTTIDDSDLDEHLLATDITDDGIPNIPEDMMKLLEEAINNENKATTTANGQNADNDKKNVTAVNKLSAATVVVSPGLRWQQHNRDKTPAYALKTDNGEQKPACMLSQNPTVSNTAVQQPPPYPQCYGMNRMPPPANQNTGNISGRMQPPAVANQMPSSNVAFGPRPFGNNMAMDMNQWQQGMMHAYMNDGNFAPDSFASNNVNHMAGFPASQRPSAFQQRQRHRMNAQMMQHVNPNLPQGMAAMNAYGNNMHMIAQSPEYTSQWQNMMQSGSNQSNFMIQQQQGANTYGLPMGVNQMTHQMTNQRPERQSPMVQVPQISQSQHNTPRQAIGPHAQLPPPQMNFGNGYPSMGMQQMGMLPQGNNVIRFPLNRNGSGATRPNHGAANVMPRPNCQQSPNQNAANASSTQMSPSCNQVTSSTDVNHGVQTDATIGMDETFQCNLSENFMDNLNSISLEATHDNMLSAATGLADRSMTSQQSFAAVDGRMTSQSTSVMSIDTSNMVVNDMGSAMSQLVEENKYLSMR